MHGQIAMLKAVIFDMDGTLGDTLPLCVEAYRQCVADVTGTRPSEQEVVSLFGLSDRGVLGGLLHMNPEDPALPILHFVNVYKRLHPSLAPAPFPGARDLLENIKAIGLHLGIISGKEDFTAEPTLDFFGLNPLIEWKGYGKPTHNAKAERLKEAMEHWQLQAHELIYVGDAPSDITLCHSVGVPIINAAWAPDAASVQAACEAAKPEYRLQDLHQVLPLILSLT